MAEPMVTLLNIIKTTTENNGKDNENVKRDTKINADMIDDTKQKTLLAILLLQFLTLMFKKCGVTMKGIMSM